MIWRYVFIIGCLALTGCASSKHVDEQVQQEQNTQAASEQGDFEQEGSEQASSEQENEEQIASANDPRDPLESVNRSIWAFNWDFLDKALLRPVAVGYREYVPHFMRKGIHNAALNLEEPSSTINNLLQGQFEGTFTSLGRFVINSSIGLLGTIDVAKEIGLERHPEEFGEVLATWGIGTGPYLMLPAIGPNDIRSGSGKFVDNAYFPLADLNIYLSIVQSAVKALEARADLVEQEELINSSLDPYLFVKDVYFQRLQNKVNNGEEQKKSEEEQDLESEFDAYLEGIE
ncbi:VacJ family lipoprotein [Paraneptunicella aestuarii]|uniref:MlaA family lipoprotein n=1 Tax=Paraneptunicella aestuarii TaxID=2831148 RepID=UPI001E53E942|nr:VacJ family lipoprotein [Paraneptunicella aestuarii]UAA38128.1 VacJ family lipoprotein [Paraneptunicella aestuarii]